MEKNNKQPVVEYFDTAMKQLTQSVTFMDSGTLYFSEVSLQEKIYLIMAVLGLLLVTLAVVL